jgi:hypothetical protein
VVFPFSFFCGPKANLGNVAVSTYRRIFVTGSTGDVVKDWAETLFYFLFLFEILFAEVEAVQLFFGQPSKWGAK